MSCTNIVDLCAIQGDDQDYIMTFTTDGTTPYNLTGTAGYTALNINVTETSVGSGDKNLIEAKVGAVSRFSVKNDGVVFPRQATTAAAPTYVNGGIYFDTTINKLRVGGATGWETITSV